MGAREKRTSLRVIRARPSHKTRRDTRQEDVEKPFDSSTRRVTYPESYITKYTTYTKINIVGPDVVVVGESTALDAVGSKTGVGVVVPEVVLVVGGSKAGDVVLGVVVVVGGSTVGDVVVSPGVVVWGPEYASARVQESAWWRI